MSEEEQPQTPPEKPKPRRLGLEIPKELQAVYANAALIANTPAEMVIDFVQVLPRDGKGRVVARVIMSPVHAKLLQRALAQNVVNYERQFGEIRIPQQSSIADQFFRFPPQRRDEGKE
jgi:hypothetical protein